MVSGVLCDIHFYTTNGALTSRSWREGGPGAGIRKNIDLRPQR